MTVPAQACRQPRTSGWHRVRLVDKRAAASDVESVNARAVVDLNGLAARTGDREFELHGLAGLVNRLAGRQAFGQAGKRGAS